MPLQERLAEDLKTAMRQHADVRRSTIRLIRSAIHNAEISQKETLDDDGVIAILSRMVRQHQESISEFKKGNRGDLVEKEETELAIVREYLPPQMTAEEITKLAKEAIDKTGASEPNHMGKVMGSLMPQVKGKADGSLVSRIVRELLGG